MFEVVVVVLTRRATHVKGGKHARSTQITGTTTRVNV